jgi:trimeric autotransporter adhesin
MVTRPLLHRRVRAVLSPIVAVPLLFSSVAPGLHAQRREVAARTIGAVEGLSEATDVGPVPVSQPMHLTLRLAPTPERQAALDQLLTAQTTSRSSAYHRWLTPQNFAVEYGATEEQITAITTWLQSQGLTVDGISKAKTRIAVSGTVDQVQRAFAVTLRNYQVSGTQHYASTTRPTMPQEISSTIAEVSGLDDLPATAKTRVAAISANGLTTVLTRDASDPLDATAAAVDANTSAILTVTTSDCSGALSPADYETYRALFRQASAQGITVVTASTCEPQSAGLQSGDLAQATALTIAPITSPLAAIDARPAWQSAPGLPNDGLRHAPDLTTSSVEDFTHTLSTILQQTEGGRQGNINAALYSLASIPDLYTQPDGANGTWEPNTGLGTVNLQTLAKVLPRATGSMATTVTLTSNTTATLAGVNLVFTATIFTTATNPVGPTGTVTFYDTFNGSLVQLGTPTPVTPNGPNQSIAIFSTTGLLAGTHSIYAVYNGDATFISATSSTLAITLADFTLTNVPQSLTVKAGQNGKAVMLLGMVGGFNGTVTFGCTPPTGTETTCAFNPVSLTGGGSTTLTITSTAATTTTQKARLDSRWNFFGGAAMAVLFCFALPRRRTGLSKLALIFAGICLTANLGCSAGTQQSADQPALTDPGTPLGTQVFTITAAGSDGVNTVRHTYQYQVTIQ